MYSVIESYMQPHKYNGNGIQRLGTEFVAVHWYGNANSTALQNIRYIEEDCLESETYASAQEFIDLNGDVYLAMHKNDMAYAVGTQYKFYTDFILPYIEQYTDKYAKQLNKNYISPNYFVYSVEMGHIDWDGNYSQETWDSGMERCADLLIEFDLDISRLIRHGDVTGKICPRLLMENETKWEQFKKEVKLIMDEKLKEYSDWAKEHIEWGINIGLTDGTNPKEFLNLERFITILSRYDELRFSKLHQDELNDFESKE